EATGLAIRVVMLTTPIEPFVIGDNVVGRESRLSRPPSNPQFIGLRDARLPRECRSSRGWVTLPEVGNVARAGTSITQVASNVITEDAAYRERRPWRRVLPRSLLERPEETAHKQ
ncbi:hypothetical protein FOZ63_032082, partial [Perkinsus olseni]